MVIPRSVKRLCCRRRKVLHFTTRNHGRKLLPPLTTDIAERFFLVQRVSAISAAEVSRLRLQVDLCVQTLVEVLRRLGHRESDRALASVRVSEDPQLLPRSTSVLTATTVMRDVEAQP